MLEGGTTSFTKKLLAIVLPTAFQQFMFALVSASDALMLGMLAQDAMSAVSLAGQIAFVENLFFAAITIGLSMLAAQYWGKKDLASVEWLFSYVMKIAAVISFAFFLAALCMPKALMGILTNELRLIQDGAVYLRCVSPSFFLTGLSQVFLCMLKNSERATKASAISSASVILNIVLNAVLIFGLFGFPKLGIVGAALATVAAKAVEVLWCAAETARKSCVKLRFGLYNRKGLRRDFWKCTMPVLGNELVWGIGFSMYSLIMGHMGSDAVAANSIANIVKNLVACFCLGLGSGSGIMVGNELGAGRLEKAKEYGQKLFKLSILCGIASGLVLLALSPLILAVTELSQTAHFYLKWMLVMCSGNMIGKSVNGTVIGGIFCAGGDSKFGFYCDTITVWCVTVPLGLIAAFVLNWPVLSVYFLVNLDEIVKLPAVYRHFIRYNWVKDLIEKEILK